MRIEDTLVVLYGTANWRLEGDDRKKREGEEEKRGGNSISVEVEYFMSMTARRYRRSNLHVQVGWTRKMEEGRRLKGPGRRGQDAREGKTTINQSINQSVN